MSGMRSLCTQVPGQHYQNSGKQACRGNGEGKTESRAVGSRQARHKGADNLPHAVKHGHGGYGVRAWFAAQADAVLQGKDRYAQERTAQKQPAA